MSGCNTATPFDPSDTLELVSAIARPFGPTDQSDNLRALVLWGNRDTLRRANEKPPEVQPLRGFQWILERQVSTLLALDLTAHANYPVNLAHFRRLVKGQLDLL